MRNCINIKANNTSFKYLLEYSKGNSKNIVIDNNDIDFYKSATCIKLFNSAIKHYRNSNDWYSISELIKSKCEYIPDFIKTTKTKRQYQNIFVLPFIFNKYITIMLYLLNRAHCLLCAYRVF